MPQRKLVSNAFYGIVCTLMLIAGFYPPVSEPLIDSLAITIQKYFPAKIVDPGNEAFYAALPPVSSSQKTVFLADSQLPTQARDTLEGVSLHSWSKAERQLVQEAENLVYELLESNEIRAYLQNQERISYPQNLVRPSLWPRTYGEYLEEIVSHRPKQTLYLAKGIDSTNSAIAGFHTRNVAELQEYGYAQKVFIFLDQKSIDLTLKLNPTRPQAARLYLASLLAHEVVHTFGHSHPGSSREEQYINNDYFVSFVTKYFVSEALQAGLPTE